MSNKVSLDFEFTQENKKALEELLKASGIRHFILETADFGKIDVVEYKEYLKLKEVIDKIKEKTIQFKDDLKMNEKIAKEQKRSNDISIQLVGLRVNAILELLEEIE